MKVLKYPTDLKALRTKSLDYPIDSFPEDQATLIDELVTGMQAEGGLGMSAPQMGHHVRVFVVAGHLDGKPDETLVFINPEITYRSADTELGDEGCLSFPGAPTKIRRYVEVRVKALDANGAEREVSAAGLFARCLQHELDHLDGKLIIDYVSSTRRAKFIAAVWR